MPDFCTSMTYLCPRIKGNEYGKDKESQEDSGCRSGEDRASSGYGAGGQTLIKVGTRRQILHRGRQLYRYRQQRTGYDAGTGPDVLYIH